jgi:hypothetical protein
LAIRESRPADTGGDTSPHNDKSSY